MPRLGRVGRRRALAAGFAAGAAALALTALRPPAAPTTPVVVAARDLPAGLHLTSEHLRSEPLPGSAVPDGAVRSPDAASGRVLATPMRRGETLTDVRLVGPAVLSGYGDGLVLAPVRIADPGAARLLRPGDRVDVLAADTGPAEGGGDGDEAAGAVRTVARASPVVAVPEPGEGT